MELSEKIQSLRKKNNMTQEQFAEKLYVSRTAVSKWETKRGMPSIESLKEISKLFNVSLDELLKVEDIIEVAKEENEENMKEYSYLFDGIVTMLALLGLLMPLYKVEIDGVFYSTSLYEYSGFLTIIYWILPSIMAVLGLIEIIINKKDEKNIVKAVNILSLITNILEVIMLILGGQPYPAILFLIFLVIKGVLLLKKVK